MRHSLLHYRGRTILAGVALLFGFPLATLAANGNIGIFTPDETPTLRVLKSDGSIIERRSELTYGENLLLSARKQPFAWVGELVSGNESLERVAVTDGGFSHSVEIMNDDALVLDTITVVKNPARLVLTMGDIFSTYPGKELIVCHQNHRPARMRVFSYNPETGEAAKLLSFQPFPELSDAGIQTGCSQLKVDDIDRDGVNEVIAANNAMPNGDLFVFGRNGLEETALVRDSAISLEGTTDTGKIFFQTIDMNADTFEDEIVSRQAMNYQDYSMDLMIHDGAGRLQATIPTSQYRYFDYAVGDVTADGRDELVVMNGKKSFVSLWSMDGTQTELGALFPNSNIQRYRRIVTGRFGTLRD
jgi:hypothetical protein